MERYYQNPLFALWLAYVLVPILDYVLPHDNYNLPEGAVSKYEKDWRWLVPIYSCWAADFGLYVYALCLCYSGRISPEPLPFALYTICAAHSAGLNLVIGHELAHRK